MKRIRSVVTFFIFYYLLVQAGTNVSETLNGLFPPVYTPVDDSGNLNLDIIPDYAKFLKTNGINGVLVAGTAGEGPKLTVTEKKLLIDAWLKAARNNGLKVILQVGGIPLPDAQELACYAELVGCDAILTLPELYYKPHTPEKLVYYMKLIASAAPNTPLLYYHIPQFTNVNLDIVTFFRQASQEITNFAGIKSAVLDDALALRDQLTSDKIVFIAGSPNIAMAALMGFRNFIVQEINMFPQIINNILNDVDTCNLPNVRYLDEILLKYRNIITQGREELPAYKVTMTFVTGINVGQALEPDLPLCTDQMFSLKSSLKNNGIPLYDDGISYLFDLL